MNTVDRMPEARRRLLVYTAAQEFASVGYERASLNRIIQACGLSKSSFYYAVASKQELFDLVVSDLTAEITEQVTITSPVEFSGEQFWETAHSLFNRLVALAESSEAFVALGRMFYLSGTPDDSKTAINETLGKAQGWMEGVIVTGRQSGQIRDDLPVDLQCQLVFTVLRTLDEWTVARLGALSSVRARALAQAQFATLRRMLEP